MTNKNSTELPITERLTIKLPDRYWFREPDTRDGFIKYTDAVAEKLGRYEDLEERLKNIYKNCNGLLEEIVEIFTRQTNKQTDKQANEANNKLNSDKSKPLNEGKSNLNLPCNIGDTIYIISRNNIIPVSVWGLDIRKFGVTILCTNEKYYGYSKISLTANKKSIDWFPTKAEARKAVSEMLKR